MPKHLVPPENCDVAERNFCATFAFSRNRATFAMERNFRATLADFGLFCANNLPFWGNLGANWTSEHP